MKSFFTFLILGMGCLIPSVSFTQNHLVAVDDSICVMAGDIIEYNVKSNDTFPQGFFNPVFLATPSKCIGLKADGQLYFLPGDENCCGEHILEYRYEICQPPDDCFGTIKVVVKCPKPDCFFVNLEDFLHSGGTAGGNPDDPDCVFACENAQAVYYVNYDSSSTYSWSVFGGTYVPGGNPAEIIVSWGATGSGTISLTITDSNGEATTVEICVDILEGPVTAFQASADSVCLNSPISFINNSVGGNGFFWDFGDGNTSNMFQPTHQYGGPGTYTVTLIVTKDNYGPNGEPLCCCSDTAMLDVFIDSLSGPNIYCVSTLCAGDSTKYWTDATNCGSYQWAVLDANGLPLSFTGQGNDTICVQWGNGPTGTVTLAVTNCDSAYCDQPVSVLIPIISPTVGINGLTMVCENDVATYTVPKWLSVDYNWQVTGGAILSGQGTNTVVIQWGTAPGPGVINLNYASNFLGGLPGHEPEDCAGMAALTVQIKTKFQVTGPIPPVVCVNTTSGFSATAVPYANYTWTITPAAPFSGQGTSAISVTWNTGPGTFVVTAEPNDTSAYCNRKVTKVIRVVETLKPDGIDGVTDICPGGTYTYFGQTSQTGVGFTWAVTGGTPGTYSGNPLTVTWNNTGPYTLAVQHFSLSAPGCTSDTIQLALLPKQLNGPLTISGPPGCINSVKSYSAAPAQHPDATYSWTISPVAAGSVIAGQGTPNIQVQWNNTPGPATLQLTVYLCNDSLVKTLPLTLNAAAVPAITQTGILCPGVTATLSAGAGYTSYAWSPSGNTQTIPITTGGTYIVTATDANGCTAVDTYQAIPLPGPVASISTPNPTLLCINAPVGGPVTITALTAPGYTYAWYCNGTLQGLPPAQNTLVHANTLVAATFNYWVVVTDANGCTKQSNTIVVVQQTCTAPPFCFPQSHNLSFTSANPAPNCNTVAFTVTKSANVTVTGWNFGDPGSNTNSGILPDAIHTYTKAGCFLVTVTATVPSLVPPNSTCTITRTGTVCVPLVADFTSTVNCQSVSFNDLSTFQPGQGPVSWMWTFGDAGTSTMQNPTHGYTAAGSYTVTLTATNAAGCMATITKTVVVAGLPAPTVSAIPSPACVGVPVNFTATGANIISWLWNFNDGATNGSQNPAHTYLTAGNYTVSLAVVDNLGCTNTITLPITVNPAPAPDTIAWSPDLTFCSGDSVTLTAPAGTGYTYLWSTGAGTQSIAVDTSGVYSVVVTNIFGCTMTPDSVVTTVLPAPTASIAGPLFICDAGCVTLSAPSGYGYTYQWLDNTNAPISGAVASTLSVCDTNLLPAYSVIVTDANGCTAVSAPFSVSLAVSPVFTITVTPDSCEGTPATLLVMPVQPNVVYSWSNGGTGPSITVIQAGTYTCIGTDTITGCKSSATATIHPLPDLCIVPAGCYEACNPDTICGPDGLAAYQWNLNGAPIAGATNQCLIVTQSGTYSLTGTTAFGCSATSDSLMLMLIDCGCGQLSAIATPIESDSCCWSLSYSGNTANLVGVLIYTNDADFNFNLGSLDVSLAVNSITGNSIGLVNSQAGDPLPANALNNFLNFCFTNIQNTPQQVVFDWYDFEFNVVCSDTLLFDCPVEPDCLYLESDSIHCQGNEVVYTMTVCNPADADFSVGYIVLQPSAPPGIVVTPNTIDETANPILPGQCRTYTFTLSGPGIENQEFCFSLTAHDEIPGDEIDTTTCCMLDTMYCIPIPDCYPCDNIGVDTVETLSATEGNCCYQISLFNNYAAGYFDGIGLCMLSTGATMTINNPFGSGWQTAGYTPTVIDLNVVPPLGSSLPLGVVQLPAICVRSNLAPPLLVEIKWMLGDSIVCRDTIELGCEPPCGYILGESIVCDPATGAWVYSGSIKNTSPYTMGEAHVVFTSPAGMNAYNTNISLGLGLAPGGTQAFSLTLGPPANPGDSVCFTVALHALNDDAQHTQCCTFHDCIVLPDCTEPLSCQCDATFQQSVAQGIICAASATNKFIYTFSPVSRLSDCDQVVWEWTDLSVPVQTTGNTSVTHQFARTGIYSVCMNVYRTTETGNTCLAQTCKDINLVSVAESTQLRLYPNPVHGRAFAAMSPYWTESAHIRVFDLLGRERADFDFPDAAGQEVLPVPLDGLATGMYLMIVESGGKKWVVKVVLE